GAMKEFIYLGLRTGNGINLQEFEQKFNISLQEVFSLALNKTSKYLHLHSTPDRYSFNLNGWLLYDLLISYFL
ncbi:MAG: hypothetical protein KAU22_09440, partial [Desulfuromonadales bacterium]|nr:hypothetical protein [Desulfuromonadales bacterium]